MNDCFCGQVFYFLNFTFSCCYLRQISECLWLGGQLYCGLGLFHQRLLLRDYHTAYYSRVNSFTQFQNMMQAYIGCCLKFASCVHFGMAFLFKFTIKISYCQTLCPVINDPNKHIKKSLMSKKFRSKLKLLIKKKFLHRPRSYLCILFQWSLLLTTVPDLDLGEPYALVSGGPP